MNEFLKYWDEVLAYWVEHGEVPASETCWNFGKIGLYPKLMPEPYIGNPADCSVVILNYNPGAADYNLSTEKGREEYRKDNVHHTRLDDPEAMCYYYARNFRERAFAGGYLGRGKDPKYDTSGLHPAGKKWWEKRLDWLKKLVPESKKLPFALELCGWHSKNWRSCNYTPEIKAYIAKHIIPVLKDAIRKSDLGIGLCVGKQFGDTVLGELGFSDITGELGLDIKDQSRGWQPIPKVNRWYRVYRSADGSYIINTWSIGSNRQPGVRFEEAEKDLINKIREHNQDYK